MSPSSTRPPAATDAPPRAAPGPRSRLAWWALVAGLGMQTLLGLTIAWGLDGALWRWHQGRVDAALGVEASAVAPYRAWVAGPLGGTIAAWALLMLLIALIPLRRGEPWAARALAVSTLAWVIIDTPTSLLHGVWINVAFNLAGAAMVLLPLALGAAPPSK